MSEPAPTDPRVLRLVAGEVSRRLGDNVRWGVYDRSRRTPLNAVLDLVSERVVRDPVLIWVDGGYPDVFTFPGLPSPVAVWSTRHLEIASAVRNLVVGEAFSNQRRELSARTMLSVMAELCLRAGHEREAARLLLLSVRGQDWFLPHSDIVMDLDVASIDEAYVAIWCFALAHEFGHHLEDGGSPDDRTLHRMVLDAVQAMPAIEGDPELFARVVADLQGDAAHPLRAEHLRAEVAADLFATETVIVASHELMSASGGGRPRDGRLIAEIVIAHTALSFIQRCRAVAEALNTRDDPLTWLRVLQMPAGSAVRSDFTQWYLARALAGLTVGESGSDNSRSLEAAVESVVGQLSPAVDVIDGGMADAMSTAISPQASDSELLRDVQAECGQTGHYSLLRTENRNFIALAQALKPSEPLLSAVVELLS